MKEYEKVIQIEPQNDAFDDVRMEYAQMLHNQLAKPTPLPEMAKRQPVLPQKLRRQRAVRPRRPFRPSSAKTKAFLLGPVSLRYSC